MGYQNIIKHSRLPIWETKASKGLAGKDYEKRKEKLLQKILDDFSTIFLSYSENPKEDGLSGDWVEVLPNYWIIPQNSRATEIYDWLYSGNWLLFVADKAPRTEVFQGYDFRNAEQLINCMVQENISLLLLSFHDNDPWIIGIQPP